MFELLIGLGGCLILLGGILMLESKLSKAYIPFAKIGKLSLTLYCLQFLFAWVLMLFNVDPTALGSDFAFFDIIVILVVIVIGLLLSPLKSGPLETAMRKVEGLFY